MGVTKRIINIEEYITGGAKCSNPIIEWDTPLCAGIKCEKQNGFIVEVSIPDDCAERCFWGTYRCQDYCINCDPIRFKVCPCDVDTDCEACSKCDPVSNICVSQCNDNEFCTDHNTCVECDETHPCTNGKQCVGGQCECPPEKPFINSRGECTPCTDDTCPPGKVCTPDGCQDPVCPSGHWHAGKKKCVQCINTGHCPPGECCTDNSCDCCPGFVRDIITKLCVKAPCVEDGDCPACHYCQTGVGCVPQICPDGQICVPGLGCVDECNCSNPSCVKPGDACISLNSETCYCKPCAGSCANGQPCGEGCYCDDNFQCQPNPCSNMPCTDGSECGPGCGCNKVTKKCEPCSSADCGTECNNLLGCHCPNGTHCSDVNGCGGPCDGYGSCPPDCTCVGGTCVPCADFSCETGACADRPECKCNGTRCEGDPDFCKDTFVRADFDCGLEAQLTLNDGCMCPGVTAYITPYGIVKDVPFFNSRPAKYQVNLALRLAKGSAHSWGDITQLHLLDETQYEDIADNDTPLSGSIDVTIKQFYQPQTWVGGAWVNNGPVSSQTLAAGGSFSFAGIARKENIQFTAHKIGIGIDVIDGVSQKKIVRYEISTKVNQLSFENNCVYRSEELATIKLDSGVFKQTTDALDSSSNIAFWDSFIRPDVGNYDLGSKFFESEIVTSSSRRNPLFTWFRSEDNIYAIEDIIRKLYVSPDVANGIVFTDTIYGPKTFDPEKQNLISPEGRVFGDMYYKVTNDCGCSEKSIDFGNMQWCSPDSMTLGNIVFSLCNKKVEVKSDIAVPCPTNWDLNSFTLHPDDNNSTFKNKHQAKYHLMIELENGTVIDTPYIYREVGGVQGLYSESNNVSIKSFNQTYTSEIIGLWLELRYGTSTEVVCDWVKEITPPADFMPTYTTTCLPNAKIAYKFMLTANHITAITAVGGVVNSGAGYKEIIANVGTEVTAYITFSDHCPLTLTLNGNCCDTLAITVLRTDSPVAGITELTSTITGGTAAFSVKYYRQTSSGGRELVGESSNSAISYKVILSSPTPGLYLGEVTDANGCVRESSVISIDPRDPNDYLVTIAPKFIGCTYTGNVGVTIPAPPDVVGGKIYYRIDSGSEQSFTITNSMYSTGEHLLAAAGHTITLIRLEVNNSAGPASVFTLTGSATVPSNLGAAIPVLNTFTVNGVSPSVNICEGDTVLIELQGSPNSIVNIDGISPIFLDGSGYGSSTQSPVVSTTYTVISVTNSNGDCPGNQGVGLTRQVAVTPTPEFEVISDVCDGSQTYRTVTFDNITSATDQFGNSLVVVGSAVTVNVNTVTEIRATYTIGTCSSTLTHVITACDAPEITGTISGPSVICEGDVATITVSGVTGGTAPYSYNYYTSTSYNENYVLNQTSKILALTSTDTVFVRVKDALGNISAIGNHTVTVASTPTPNIVPIDGSFGITETSDNVFTIDDNVTNAVFKTVGGYTTYNWLVTGTYGGTASGSGSTFTIEVAQITGTIELKVTVTTENGCVGVETVAMSVVAAPVLLSASEILFSTSSYKLYKVSVTTSAIGVPALLCGSSNPAYGVALRSNGDLIGILGVTLYNLYPLSGCGNASIGAFSNVTQSIGMLTADKVVGQTPNVLQTYDLSTDTVNNNHYTISDGTNDYTNATDLVKIGSMLYSTCSRYIAGVFQDHVLLRFTLDGTGAVTAFANLGATPNQASSAVGLAYDGTDAYLIFGDGKVYHLNLTTPSSSTLIGTILVPNGEAISDTTNN